MGLSNQWWVESLGNMYSDKISTVALPMRDALRREAKYVKGLAAKVIIESFLDPVDYDWLMTLLDRYDPPHAIEFSNYSIPWGTLNRRLIIWECRLY